MNKLKIIILVLFIIFVVILCSLVYSKNHRMQNLDAIEITRIRKIDFALSVPVAKTLLQDRSGYESFLVADKKSETYILLWNSANDDLYFYIHRLYGGFITMSATYKITEPIKKSELLDFLKTHFVDSELPK